MQKISTTIILAFIIAFTSPKLLGQTNIGTSNKKVTSKEWSPLLDESLSQWEVWTGVPEPSVKNLPPNYKKRDKANTKQRYDLGIL